MAMACYVLYTRGIGQHNLMGWHFYFCLPPPWSGNSRAHPAPLWMGGGRKAGEIFNRNRGGKYPLFLPPLPLFPQPRWVRVRWVGVGPSPFLIRWLSAERLGWLTRKGGREGEAGSLAEEKACVQKGEGEERRATSGNFNRDCCYRTIAVLGRRSLPSGCLSMCCPFTMPPPPPSSSSFSSARKT